MKEAIYSWLRRCFFRFGRFIEIRRFPSPQELHNELIPEDRQIHFYELKRVSKALKEINAQDYYDRLLTTYIPQWDKKVKKAQFIGEGHSDNGLNVYRKISSSDETLFEKIYDTDSTAVKRLLWLDKNIFSYFENKFKIPRIKAFYKGEILTIIYFDYLNISGKNKNSEEQAIEISRYFYVQSQNPEFLGIFNSAPPYMTDFRYHGKYNAWIRAAQNDLKKNGWVIGDIESKLASGRLVFTHGDIKPDHLASKNGLIDWDEAGFYPAGFEQSYLYLSYQMTTNQAKEEPLIWLENHFKSMVNSEEWDLFKQSFLYFLFVFAQKVFQKGNALELRTYLIKNLKEYV